MTKSIEWAKCKQQQELVKSNLAPTAHHDFINLNRTVLGAGKTIATLDFKPHALIRPIRIRLLSKRDKLKQKNPIGPHIACSRVLA